ncbi:MAG: hypothetical protein KGI60_00875 [Patescibacteria group bacterium]|nr:hypothetical protein [Patescibacteria group bacterium]
MSNFEKNLEEASEQELYRWVNLRDFRVVPLASDELTRRRLSELKNSIKNLDEGTRRYSRALIFLTIVLALIGIMQLVATLFMPDTLLGKIVFGLTISGGFIMLFNRIEGNFKDF